MQLYHAICAVSLLSLAFKNQASWEEAFQHYEQAISPQRAMVSQDDLVSDGVLFLHFLLLIYDVCFVCKASQPGDNTHDVMTMWVQHLHQLLRIARQRKQTFDDETRAYIIWAVGLMCIEATLAGGEALEFLDFILEVSPALRTVTGPEHYAPTQVDRILVAPWNNLQLADEAELLPMVQDWHRQTTFSIARVAVLARRLRTEAIRTPLNEQRIAARQQEILQAQSELYNAFHSWWPRFLPRDVSPSELRLPPRVQHIFIYVSRAPKPFFCRMCSC